MSLNLSDALRNARIAAIEATIGLAPVLKIRTGSKPATCAAADSGTVITTITLPDDWLQTPASGQADKVGTWQQLLAAATGTAGHFRLYASNGTTCHVQGTVTKSNLGGDMTLDFVDIGAGQAVTIDTFILIDNNG
jgi:hypothetical protein